jgi:hypothetical protein
VSSNPIAELPSSFTCLVALQEFTAHHCRLRNGFAGISDFTTLPNLQVGSCCAVPYVSHSVHCRVQL